MFRTEDITAFMKDDLTESDRRAIINKYRNRLLPISFEEIPEEQRSRLCESILKVASQKMGHAIGNFTMDIIDVCYGAYPKGAERIHRRIVASPQLLCTVARSFYALELPIQTYASLLEKLGVTTHSEYQGECKKIQTQLVEVIDAVDCGFVHKVHTSLQNLLHATTKLAILLDLEKV